MVGGKVYEKFVALSFFGGGRCDEGGIEMLVVVLVWLVLVGLFLLLLVRFFRSSTPPTQVEIHDLVQESPRILKLHGVHHLSLPKL